MRITSWNLFSSEASPSDYRLEQIIDSLDSFSSDVYILQNITSKEYRNLKEIFSRDYQGFFTSYRRRWKKGRGNAIFILRNLELGESRKRSFLLSKNGNTACIVSFARIVFVSLQLEERYGIEQIFKLLHYLDKRFWGRALILGGTFMENMALPNFQVDHAFPTCFRDRARCMDHIYTKGFLIEHVLVPDVDKTTKSFWGSEHVPITIE